jgi:LacI family transcriptional regulator
MLTNDNPMKTTDAPREAVGRASLKAIAALTGVSAATVSRVLNNRHIGFSVRPELRARIEEVARTSGYRPDLMAKSLRKGGMGIFGLVGLEPPFNFPQRMVEGILGVLEPRGIQLSAHFTPHQGGALEPPAWRVDGIFVLAAHKRSDVEPIDVSGIPYVSINAWHGPHGMAVMMNDAQGTGLAMRHLLDLGHRRVAFALMMGPWRTHPSVRERRGAYRAALRAAGQSPLDELPSTQVDDATEFLSAARSSGATAVLAYNHHVGMAVLKAAYAAGLAVPRDLSIVCFNDEYDIDLVHPPLTRIVLPVAEAGRVAAGKLMEIAGGADLAGQVVRLDETLLVRGSTAAPARR